MNPLAIRAENFLSYSKLDLDLSGVNLAAIVGPNGAGKSSLLDIITWTLYGFGRYDLIDAYIRQGTEQMMAEVSFELNGKIYRVTRTRSSKGRGKTTLEFAVQDGTGWKPLSGTTIMETQEKIVNTLRLDYNTFVSTCFILQKQSDKLTSATPAERKQAFAKVLGLDYYDKLLEKAKERAKAYRERISHYQAEISLLENRIGNKSQLEQEHRQYKVALARLQENQKEMQDIIRTLEKEKDALQRQLDEKHNLMKRKEELHKRFNEIDGFFGEMAKLEYRIESNEGIDEKIASKAQAKAETEKMLEEYNNRLTELKIIAGKIPDLKAAIAKARKQEAELLQEGGEIDRKLGRYKKILANADMVRETAKLYNQLQEELKYLDRKHTMYHDLKEKAQGLEAKVAAFDKEQESAIERIEALIDQAKKQVEPLDKAPCTEDMQSRCPLLRNAVETKSEIVKLELEKAAWEAKANPYADEWQAACKERDAVGYDEARHQAVTAQIAELEPYSKLLPELEHAEETIKELEEKKRANGDKIADASKEIGRLATELEKAEYTQKKVAGFEIFIKERKREVLKLDDAIKGLQEKQAKIEAYKEQLEKMQEEAFAKQEEMEHISAEILEIDEKIKSVTRIEAEIGKKNLAIKDRQAELDSAMQDTGRLQAQLGKVEAKLEDIKKAETQKAEIATKTKDDAHEAYLYDMLSRAFGKNGIPALIIENALPEVEIIANDLLGSLTDGRMRLELVSQKETKTAGITETLDIVISDELGSRPYEGWSGAESYEVDIALRVAVSKFLAKRAGASVKTLVIDEGLGSLDAYGKQKFIEAISILAGDFDKVLCISHIDEIKEAFPQQIVITKTPGGSVAEVV